MPGPPDNVVDDIDDRPVLPRPAIPSAARRVDASNGEPRVLDIPPKHGHPRGVPPVRRANGRPCRREEVARSLQEEPARGSNQRGVLDERSPAGVRDRMTLTNAAPHKSDIGSIPFMEGVPRSRASPTFPTLRVGRPGAYSKGRVTAQPGSWRRRGTGRSVRAGAGIELVYVGLGRGTFISTEGTTRPTQPATTAVKNVTHP